MAIDRPLSPVLYYCCCCCRYCYKQRRCNYLQSFKLICALLVFPHICSLKSSLVLDDPDFATLGHTALLLLFIMHDPDSPLWSGISDYTAILIALHLNSLISISSISWISSNMPICREENAAFVTSLSWMTAYLARWSTITRIVIAAS